MKKHNPHVVCLPLGQPNEAEARRYMRQRTYTQLFDRWMRDRDILTPYSDTPLEISR
jgi:hypothetical protein